MKIVNNGLTIEIGGALGHFPKEFVVSALEKQTKKKPLILGKRYVGVARAGICPNCGMTENNSGNYCRYCGQALDWSDSE